MIVYPASLRQQWEQELRDKFALPSVVVDKTVVKRQSGTMPEFLREHIGHNIFIASYQFITQQKEILGIES